MHPSGVSRLYLFRSKNLNENYLLLFIKEIINGLFPVAVCKKIGNNYSQSVARAYIRTIYNRGTDVGVPVKLQIFQLINGVKESLLSENYTVGVLANIFLSLLCIARKPSAAAVATA